MADSLASVTFVSCLATSQLTLASSNSSAIDITNKTSKSYGKPSSRSPLTTVSQNHELFAVMFHVENLYFFYFMLSLFLIA